MNDWDLRIFETVARLGGIGRAAAELNTVQSNVTTRMRHLEEELGVPLLDRHSRGGNAGFVMLDNLTRDGMGWHPQGAGLLTGMRESGCLS